MAFGYYKSVTINHTQCGTADSTDFPVTIWVTDADLKTVGNGGFVQNSSGFDIRPYSDSALTTALTFELVAGTYVATTGAVEMHVKIPTLSHTADTVFYLAFGNSSISTDGSSTSTWDSNFVLVAHLPNGTTLTANDSTATPSNGTLTNTPTATAGVIDGAGSFASASTQYVTFGTASKLNPTAVTCEAWVKGTTFPNAYNTVVAKVNGTGTAYYSLYVKSTGKLACYMRGNNNVSYDGTGSTTLSTGTNYYLATVYSATAGVVGYVNAGSDGTATADGALATNSGATQIAGDPLTSGRNWNGVLDEIRISNIVRPTSYLTSTYNNQKPSSTFLTWGSRTPTAVANSNFLFF